jgi:hypothetical protein
LRRCVESRDDKVCRAPKTESAWRFLFDKSAGFGVLCKGVVCAAVWFCNGFPLRVGSQMLVNVFSVRRSCLTATIVACLGVALSNQTAEASCGDWLAGHQGPAVTQTNGAGSPEFAQTEPVSNVPVAPCHGPSCRSNPELPITPAPAPELPTHRDAGALCRLLGVAGGLEFEPFPAVADAAAASGYPLAIEHPPRV